MKLGLKEETITKINSVFTLHLEVEEVIIYGSRAKGNYRNGSDLDLTLTGSALNDDILTKINLEIDDLNTPYLFDISIFHRLNSPDLQDYIKRIGKIFYKKG